MGNEFGHRVKLLRTPSDFSPLRALLAYAAKALSHANTYPATSTGIIS